MIIVTGGAGFIGSQIIKLLNAKGHNDILVVDNLANGTKFKNLSGLDIHDYLDKDDFLDLIKKGLSTPYSKNTEIIPRIEAIFHQGACSDTTEWNGQYMMENNYAYSKHLLNYCLTESIPFIYASSASVYGEGRVFKEERQYEKPINMYGYSKFLFDQYVRKILSVAQSPIVGLRYFNVYGPNEEHKGRMSSVAFHFNHQIKQDGVIRLFEGSDEFGPGEQCRDFIYVEDVAKINLWFFEQFHRLNKNINGIFNVGTGKSQSFKEIANAVISHHGSGSIEYIPFPDDLRGRYQSFTQADISRLRAQGYSANFKTVQEGVELYLNQIDPLMK